MVSLYPLRLISDKTNFDFAKNRFKGFMVSIFLVLTTIFALFSSGLNFGIDFVGGIVIEASIKDQYDITDLRKELSILDLGEVSLQNLGSSNEILIKVGGKSKYADQAEKLSVIKNHLLQKYSSIDFRKIDYVGPQVGRELVKNGASALILSFAGIMLYIWARFEWQFSIGVILALIHDVIATIGFASLFQFEFNLTSIAALLTIIGYSVNDSVVIYDRIRENLRKYKSLNIIEIINLSINETLSRTLLTVLTTLLSSLSLILFAGEAIKSFSYLVFFGIVVGTYSSIFISAPILIYFGIEKFKRPSSKEA